MTYELYYWPGIQGRGEFVRLALEEAGAAYVDMAREHGPGRGVAAMTRMLKGGGDALTPFAPPFLKDGDFVVSHVANILAYLGPKLGLAPRTEKLTFPLVFEVLGIEADREGVVVVECGGKGNIPLFARVCNACRIPYVVVYDRDAPQGRRPVDSEAVVNRQIREVAGRRRTVELVPDFEAISGVDGGGRGRKPQKAWRRYSGNGDVPAPLLDAVERVIRAARG